MHLVTGTNEGICLASLALVPRFLPTSRSWPRGPLPRAPSSYEIVSLTDPVSAQAAHYTIGLLEAVWGRAQFHERDSGCTSITVTRGRHCAPSEVSVVVQNGTLLPQLFV